MEGEQGVSLSSTGSSEENVTNAPWFEAYADELCPYYMSIGVSYDEYWEGDYTKLVFYVKADEYKKERDNETAWLQGLYVYEAVGCLAPVLHAFSKKGTKPGKYSEKPYPVTERQRVIDEKEKQFVQKLNARNEVMKWINEMKKIKRKEDKNE